MIDRMKNTTFQGNRVALLGAVLLFLYAFQEECLAGAEEPRPNIVLIYVDDLDFDELSVYDYRQFPSYTGMLAAGYSLDHFPLPLLQNGFFTRHDETRAFEDPRMLTPNIQKLADQGAIFTRFYITSPVCTPSRYTTLTGRLASRNPQLTKEFSPDEQINIRWSAPILIGESTVIKALNRLGYKTGMSGKWHNGLPGIDPETIADQDSVHALGVGPESDINDPKVIRAIQTAHDTLITHLEDRIGFTWAKTVSYANKEQWPVPHSLRVHNLEWITQGALDFLDSYHSEPFFLYISLPVPHASYYEGWEKDYNILATPRGLLTENPDSQPSRASIFDRLESLGIDRRSGMGTWIDDSVGAVLKRLDELGLTENTVVIFTSDHQDRGKNTCYEGARVPFILRWPGVVRKGRTIDALASNTDLAPTFIEMAGGQAEPDMLLDGKSLLPLLKGERDSHHSFVYLEMGNTRAVVADRWKLIKNRVPEYLKVINPHVWERESESIASAMSFDALDALEHDRPRRIGWDGVISSGGWKDIGIWFYSALAFPHYFDPDQLYDLEEDPFEQHNLLDKPGLEAIQENLTKILQTKINELQNPFGEYPADY